MGQTRKLAPSALFGEQGHQLVERMGRRQHRQQMDTPQLRRAQAPMRAPARSPVPVLVDEVVRNVRIHQRKKLRRAGRRKYRIHGPAGYPFGLYLSAESPWITNLECKLLIINVLQQNS